MTWVRPFILLMAIALVVQAGIYFLMSALGTSGELAVAFELIWLCIVAVVAGPFVDRPER